MKKILMVDDHHHTHRLAKMALAKLDVEILNVLDGEAGLISARLENPDLIILDLTMPERTGLEVLNHLRATEELKHVPVLVLTAQDDEDEIRRVREAGATEFMAKPFHPAKLVAAVEGLLAR